MVVCLVFDIDDTIYVHKSDEMNYNNIRPDYQLKSQLQRLNYPKYILSNATYGHANLIVNRLGIMNEFEKIYARDNIPQMKPSFLCYKSVIRDIEYGLLSQSNEYIFFDDLLENLEGAKKQGWNTVWISPEYLQSYKYPFVNKAFPTLKGALDKLNF
jgi:HAD superfamily hydrolase (TIGR01509 family)